MNKKIFNKKVSLEMADKKKYIGFSYIQEREKYLNSIGEYRCENTLKEEEKCIKQCYECSQIYVEKTPVKNN